MLKVIEYISITIISESSFSPSYVIESLTDLVSLYKNNTNVILVPSLDLVDYSIHKKFIIRDYKVLNISSQYRDYFSQMSYKASLKCSKLEEINDILFNSLTRGDKIKKILTNINK